MKKCKIACIFPSGHFFNTPCIPNLAGVLGEEGYEVSVYLAKNSSAPTGDNNLKGVDLVYFPLSLSRAREPVMLLSLGFWFWLVKVFLLRRYDFVIACGIRALFVVGSLSRLLNLNYAYDCLEIYSRGNRKGLVKSAFKVLESYFNRRAKFTIIQDSVRGEVLKRNNCLKSMPIVLFPNLPISYGSEEDNPANIGCEELRVRLGIPANREVILYSGSLEAPWSGLKEIMKVCARLPDGWILCVQSRMDSDSWVNFCRENDLGPESKVVASLRPLSTAEYDLLVRSARIGLAWYESEDENIRYVGLSSGKIAHYLSHGKPVIVNRLPLYEDVFEEFRCGVLVDDATEICERILEVEENYDAFSDGAKMAYVKVFAPDNYKDNILAAVAQYARIRK